MLYFNISSASFFFLFRISQCEVITWQTGSVGQNKGLTAQRQQSREVQEGGGGREKHSLPQLHHRASQAVQVEFVLISSLILTAFAFM